MVKIEAPNRAYTGVSAGIRFVDGSGEIAALSDTQRAYLSRHGFAFDEPKSRSRAASKANTE